MKNSGKQYLILIGIIFASFIIGVFIGRVTNPYTPLSTDDTVLTNDITTSTDDPVLQDKNDKININTATADELKPLPGIGDELSKRIIEYRTENGPFESIEDLINVKGIGNINLNKIKDYITTGE